MKPTLRQRVVHGLSRLWRDESGQGMTEYASLTTILILGGIASGLAWPYTKYLFRGLQTYIDFYYYCLNVAVG